MNSKRRSLKPGAPLFYGCKCVFLHKPKSSRGKYFYEETIVVVNAPDDRVAARKARRLGNDYAGAGVVFCDLVAVYPILDDTLTDGVEVFAGFRRSRLAPKSFLKRFYIGPSSLAAGLPG